MCTSDRHRLTKAVWCCLAIVLGGSYSCTAVPSGTACGCYVVAPADDARSDDARWAEYLAGQMQRRSSGGRTADSCSVHGEPLSVRVHVDSLLANDYVVERRREGLLLSARDSENMLSLVYQFLSSCAGCGLEVSDLPPAFVSMEGDRGDFAFEYRGIYTPSNSDPELMPITASHNVDYDWALWGHNLRRVFDGEVPREACALVDGERTEEQFCFSSEELFEAVSRFVRQHDASDETARFVVMPNDNGLVCQCPACVEAGNTPGSATPAVSRLLHRLAVRYPDRLFFTSSYMTTVEPPSEPLPSNVGVWVSAISVPMREKFTSRPATKKFAALVSRWHKVVGRVYVWDYMRNFDDYFTPYPCLRLLGERLKFYRSIGVSGLFFNGSSPSYASFDDVQTAAVAALLVRPELPVADYAGRCFERYYPASSDVLASAYSSWEDAVARSRALLPFYGGIGDAVKAWLSPDEFALFCDSLDHRAKLAGEAERSRLNPLLTALWFTRLELLRRPGGGYSEPEARRFLDGLSGYASFPAMASYREAMGQTADYIKEWDVLMRENREAARNRLRGMEVTSVSRPDGSYSDLSPLTDGLCGLPTDYHTGWVIASPAEVVWSIPAGRVRTGDALSLSFLHAPRWRIFVPRSVEVWQSGRCVGRAAMPSEAEAFARHKVVCKVVGTVSPGGPLEVRLRQAEGKRPTLACDEMAVFGPKR